MRRSNRIESSTFAVAASNGNYQAENSVLPDILEPEGSIHLPSIVFDNQTGGGETGDNDATAGELGTQPNSNESLGDGLSQTLQAGKPQVIVRIRPSPNIDIDSSPTFEVDQQTKTIQIRVDRDRKAQELTKRKPPPGFIYFPADDVLENSSQEDTFTAVAMDVVEKAIMGISGMIVAIGPEISGKSFSLFGLCGRYHNRGIAARTMEKLFEIKDQKQGEIDFKFGMGVIEVRRERIRDLLTLSPNEINDVGDRGPKGMYFEEVDCLEHGLGLLLRALIGQKLIHQEPYERYHTVVYFEIIGSSPLASELVQFHSRITFAEIASAPYRPDTTSSLGPTSLFCGSNSDICQTPLPVKPDGKFKSKLAVFPAKKCCNPGHATGPLAESIAVRRDIFALEQIFLKANEMYRIRKYFAKLENLGLSMIVSEKRRIANGRNFRQNRLAHCLKDILGTNTEIRILLHVRPEKAYLKSSLEAMRFAERARLVPSNLDEDLNKGKPNRTDDQILQEVITDIAPELMNPSNVESLNSEKMKVIQEQAVQYFENNIDSMKICSKEKVKRMFENFRVLWNFLWELELNVTLRKAEDEMKLTMEKMGHASSSAGLGVDASNNLHKPSSPRRGSDGGRSKGGGGTDGDDDELGKDQVGAKKSKGKGKKDKKKKKEKQSQQNKRTSSNDLKPASEIQDGKRGSTLDAGEDQTDGIGNTRLSRGLTDGDAPGEDLSQMNGETEVSNTSPPYTSNESPVLSAPPPTSDSLDARNGRNPSTGSVPMSGSKRVPTENGAETTEAGENFIMEDAIKDPFAIREDAEMGDPIKGQGSLNQNDAPLITHAPVSGTQPPVSNTTHFHHPADFGHNATFFARGGFADFKLRNVWGANHSMERKSLTEEERRQLSVQQEETISNNFEEMKKVARRQAIHLLRAGVRRPQWVSLF